MENQPLQKFIHAIREQIQLGETQNALDLLQGYLSAASEKLRNEVSLYVTRYNRLRRDGRKGIITRAEAQAEQALLENALLEFLEEIPKFIEQNASPSPAVVNISADYPEIAEISFEKIIGINNLRQLSWLQRGVEVSKSVCRILTPSGFGTGFLIGKDRLMTNNHVISSAEIANQSYAEFNYQQDTSGKYLLSHRFRLSSALFHTSPRNELDYSIIGLEPTPGSLAPESWVSLELNPNADPIPTEHVSIVQHPNGGLKQIVLTANRVINSKAQYLFYTTDTMPGSSGSPVFNDLWQVVAIHHADGGVKQDPKGDQFYANEGILMSAIKQHAGPFWPSP
ncbi:MAG TPA: trypsin-like peptidase domain-containing protein [Pyrinomonadaceae bacterium]|nr:trypsin-like peptidase domain-containing protein [Pyrinomonadaceae bacterium]